MERSRDLYPVSINGFDSEVVCVEYSRVMGVVRKGGNASVAVDGDDHVEYWSIS